MLYRICVALLWIPVTFIFWTKRLGYNRFIKKGRCLTVCNHYSAFDPALLGVKLLRRQAFMGKKELFRSRLRAWYFRTIGVIPVNREKMELSTYKGVMTALAKDKMVTLFPEGVRNRENFAIKQIKGGAAGFAIRGKSKILPVILYRPAKAFRLNYIQVGQEISLEEFYDRKLTPEEMETAEQMVVTALKKTQAELNAYVENKNKKKQGKKSRKNKKVSVPAEQNVEQENNLIEIESDSSQDKENIVEGE